MKSSAIVANDIPLTLGAAYRPTVPVVDYMYPTGFTVMQPNGQLLIALAGGTTGYFGTKFPIGA